MNQLFRKLKIALINSSLDQPYCSYGDHWRDGFEDAGCDVTVFPYQDIPLIPPGFDLYFFVEIRYNCQTIPWHLHPRVLYSWDSHVVGTYHYEIPCTCFTKVCLASKIDVDTLRSKGFNNVEWVPEACNPRVHKNLHHDRPIKLGLIGHTAGGMLKNGKTRNDFLEHLDKSTYGIHRIEGIYGDKYSEEQNKIQVMFDRTITHNLGTRIFESGAAGCVPLWSADYKQSCGIDELMIENVHYVPYVTIEDLDKTLAFLFANPSKMDFIAKNAEKHVLDNHTYAHRVWKILEKIGLKTTKIIKD
jgi:Glycosyl transferases group 1